MPRVVTAKYTLLRSMRRQAPLHWAMCILTLTACTDILAHRKSGPIVRPTGEPQTPCEHEDWLHVVPVRTSAVGSTSAGNWTTYVRTARSGLAFYRGRSLVPERLPKLLPELSDPPPLAGQLEAIKDNDRLTVLGNLMELSGYVAAGTSVIPLITMDYEEPSALNISAAIALFVGGIALAIWSNSVEPSARRKSEINIQRVTIQSKDLDTVGPLIDRKNLETRDRCQQGL